MVHGAIISITLLYSDIIMSATKFGSVYENAEFIMSLCCKCWLSACAVSLYFFLEKNCLLGVIGAFVWYLAVSIEWSDWPVLCVVTLVILCGQLEYIWSIHEMGFCFM